ncbi:MAG: GAF domain-containing protein [Nitrospiraceae bacterium]|jgi:transcriptional regulator with GAF, ATPase, and Fis domain|nr:MAG: GAF domain-containing protein [Nitrospiraceae bacterium]
MEKGELGKNYAGGEIIFREGEKGEVMYAIQSGKVKITKFTPSGEITIATLQEGDIFGEMALFDRLPRSANAVALDEARVLSIDKKKLFTTINRDPTLVFKILESMSQRIRSLNEELAKLRDAKAKVVKICPDVKVTCGMILDQAKSLVKAANGSLMLLDNREKTLVIMAAFGIEREGKADLRKGYGIAGDVLKTGRAELINSVREDKRFENSQIEIGSMLCIPLKCDTHVLGVINMSHPAENYFSLDDLSMMNTLSFYASLALQNALNFVNLKNATDGILKHATMLNEYAAGMYQESQPFTL